MVTNLKTGAVSMSDGRIAVIAGGGALPVAVAQTLKQQGSEPFVVIIDGETSVSLFNGIEHVVMSVEQLGQLLPLLKHKNITKLIMAGNVARRPRLSAIKWSFSTLALLPRVAKALILGDDGLLSTMVSIVEANGIQVVGAHQLLPSLLAPAGVITTIKPLKSDGRDIEAASIAAFTIGQLDIGQAAVAVGGRVIALEGIEGTDGLLERAKNLRAHGRISGKTRGVLAKRCKPQQETRVDLPAIGPDTVKMACEAGLSGIAVEAGRSFILEFDATISLANELGIFVVGLSSTEGKPN